MKKRVYGEKLIVLKPSNDDMRNEQKDIHFLIIFFPL